MPQKPTSSQHVARPMQGPFCTVQAGSSGGFKYPSYLQRYDQLGLPVAALLCEVLTRSCCMLRSFEAAGAVSTAEAGLPGLQTIDHAAWLPSTHGINIKWLSDTEKLKPVKYASCSACTAEVPLAT